MMMLQHITKKDRSDLRIDSSSPPTSVLQPIAIQEPHHISPGLSGAMGIEASHREQFDGGRSAYDVAMRATGYEWTSGLRPPRLIGHSYRVLLVSMTWRWEAKISSETDPEKKQRLALFFHPLLLFFHPILFFHPS